MHVSCRGRDLLTDSDGTPTALAEARIDAEVGFSDGTITAISAEPALPGLDELVGTAAYSGFRRAAGEVVADERASHSVSFQLLDDLPISLMLSGRVLRTEGISLGRPGRRPPIDLCAGWVDGGTLVRGFTELGPPLHLGPVARSVYRKDDPLAWHEAGVNSPCSTTRSRRLDLWLEDGRGQVDAWFRDSHTDGSGVETVVHEYTVTGEVDPRSHEVLATAASPGTLPAPECPSAVTSVARLVGAPVEGLREWVSATMTVRRPAPTSTTPCGRWRMSVPCWTR